MKKGRYGKRPGPSVNDDLLRGDFSAVQPNRLWITDLTECPTAEGNFYSCGIKDVVANGSVGHAVSDPMTADLAITPLQTPLARIETDGVVIVHDD